MKEKSHNQYGLEQKIENFEGVIKIGNKFLQVRLIETEKFNQKPSDHEFTKPMPRAKFVEPTDKNICYIVTRESLMKMKGEIEKQ
jgi:hypothetical protein